MDEVTEPEFAGVEFVESQLAVRAWVFDPAGDYEDYFGDEVAASLVRELVVLTRKLDAERNYPACDAAEICKRLQHLLRSAGLERSDDAYEWLAKVPMTRSEFEAETAR